MPTAKWLTPPTLAGGIANYAPEPEPRGLLGFMGGGPDFGADVGDRLGVISQILMNLGSGRGGAGIAEATSAANARSDARQQRRKAERMVGRMADKLEGSNPEMAAVMRANTEFGLQILGKQLMMPFEFEQEQKLTTMREEAAYKRALDLQNAKSAAEDKRRRLMAEMWGLSVPSDPTSQPTTGDIPVDAIVPNDPNATSLGTGEGEIVVSPISEQSTIEPAVPDEAPAAAAQDGIDWMVGLPDNPVQAKALVNLRKQWGDPDMPVEDMFQLSKAAMNDDNVGFDEFKRAVAARKETRRRSIEFATRSNEVARQNQPLPGINLQAPGQLELMQAGIDPLTVPPEQQTQEAEYLKQAFKTGDKDFTAALKDLRPSDAAGYTIKTGPEGTEISFGKTGATKSTTADQGKAAVYYDQAVTALGTLNLPESVEALATPSAEVFTAMMTPEGMANILNSDQFSAATKSALAFTEAVVRYKSGAQITPSELAMNYQIYVPQLGEIDKPRTLAFKRRLREKAARAIGKQRSAAAIAEDGYDDLNEAIANGDIEPGDKYVPPMAQWAIDGGVTPEQWQAGDSELWFPTDQQKKEE